MRRSSTASERVFVPKLKLSRWALFAWTAQHATATTGLWLAALDTYVKVVVSALILLSALIGRPQRCRIIARRRNGSWSLPEEQLAGLQTLPGTQYTQWWVILRIGCADGRTRTLRLWRDAWSAADWRALQISLREYRRAAAR